MDTSELLLYYRALSELKDEHEAFEMLLKKWKNNEIEGLIKWAERVKANPTANKFTKIVTARVTKLRLG